MAYNFRRAERDQPFLLRPDLIAFRVLAANQTPDHVTIARFRVRHQQALAGFLVESLKLCAAAGLIHLGLVALDGTKVAANAANTASHTHDKLEREVAEILRQAAEADQRDDLEHGQACGDELPAALAAAARTRGKQPRSHIKPRRRDDAPNPKATANVTDPDSRFMHTRQGSIQGYNAQAVTTCEQVIVAAELTQQANDVQQLQSMLMATMATLGRRHPPAARDVAGRLRLLDDRQPDPAPGRAGAADPAREARPPRQAPQGRQAIGVPQRRAPRRDAGQARQRRWQSELRQAQGDHRAGVRPAQGAAGGAAVPARGLVACEAEWKLLCGTHNLLKLWRHRTSPRSASPATT